MNDAVAIKWIAALRSGDYIQGSGALRRQTDEADEFCCFGVLCDLYAKEHPGARWETDPQSGGAPGGPTGFHPNGDPGFTYGMPPPPVLIWANIQRYGDDDLVSSAWQNLAYLNDTHVSFETIAARIKLLHEGTCL